MVLSHQSNVSSGLQTNRRIGQIRRMEIFPAFPHPRTRETVYPLITVRHGRILKDITPQALLPSECFSRNYLTVSMSGMFQIES